MHCENMKQKAQLIINSPFSINIINFIFTSLLYYSCLQASTCRYTGAACLTRRRTQDQAGTARTQEGNRASGVDMHLSVSWGCLLTRRRTQDPRGGALSPLPPPPTPKPSTTSRTGRGGGGVQTCIWDAVSGN